jgi:oxidoreductase
MICSLTRSLLFCCYAMSCCFLQDAGSAEVFRKVDHDYVAAAAAAAKAAGVPYFGLVSAQGANAAMPASDWKLLHPLLYTRTKGLVSS